MAGFYLMGKKGYSVLSALVDENLKGSIDFVVCAKDPQIQKDYFSEIKELCAREGIRFQERNAQEPLKAEHVFAIAWRWLIPVQDKLIILHDSLLPEYRGFAPLVNYLINGESKIGVTALFAQDEYDTGDIILQRSIDISYPVKIEEAIEMISGIYAGMVVSVMRTIASGQEIKSTPQDHAKASYSIWRDEQDYRIDWKLSAEHICRFIDAVGFPYNGASSLVNGVSVRIRSATALPDVKVVNRTIGKVIFMKKEKPVVICGSGLLQVDEMSWDSGGSALPLKQFRSRFE